MAEISKQFKLREIKRCKNPVYFMKNYIYIQHPTKGKILFKTWEFQEKALEDLLNYRFNIILKSRQLGFSTLTSAFILWMALFNKNKFIGTVSIKREDAAEIINKIKYAYDNLPEWLKISEIATNNVFEFSFKNGSKIKATATTSNIGRGSAFSLLFIDEAAFIEGLDEAWASAWPTLSTGGQAIINSTPNGASGFFYDMYTEAEAGNNDFHVIKLSWDVHPERDQEWYETTKKNMSETKFAQEYLCLRGDTKIITKDGYKLIENIQIGDEVLTHNGRFKKVIKTFEREINENETYFVNSPLSITYPIQITENHPILTAEKIKNQKLGLSKNIRNFIKNDIYQSSWKSLQEIDLKRKVRNYEHAIFPKFKIENNSNNEIIDLNELCHDIVYNKTEENVSYYKQKNSTKRFIKKDYDLGKLLGLFLAEGSYQNNKLSFAFHRDENELISFVQDFFKKYNIDFSIEKRTYSKCTLVETYNKFIFKIFKKFINGKYCWEKHLNEDFVNWNKKFIKGIIDGLWLGDGLHEPKEKNILSLTSEKLVYQTRLLMSSFNCITRISQKQLKNKNNKIQYVLELNNVFNKKIDECTEHGLEYNLGSRAILSNDFWWAKPKIEKVNSDKLIKVYNIEVEEDNSYCPLGLVVHNCDFALSGDTVVSPTVINKLRQAIKAPKYTKGPGNNLWIWKEYDYSSTYILTADTARGDGADFSAFHVLNSNTMECVAEFKGKVKIDIFADLVIETGFAYGLCLVVPENNSIGNSLIEKLIEKEYPSLFYSEKSTYTYVNQFEAEHRDDVIPGIYVNMKTRPWFITKWEEYMRKEIYITYSSRFVSELENFVYHNGKPQARKGKNDDLIICSALACWVRDTALSTNLKEIEYKKQFLLSFKKEKRIFDSSLKESAPIYKFKGTDGKYHDFSWIIKG